MSIILTFILFFIAVIGFFHILTPSIGSRIRKEFGLDRNGILTPYAVDKWINSPIVPEIVQARKSSNKRYAFLTFLYVFAVFPLAVIIAIRNNLGYKTADYVGLFALLIILIDVGMNYRKARIRELADTINKVTIIGEPEMTDGSSWRVPFIRYVYKIPFIYLIYLFLVVLGILP